MIGLADSNRTDPLNHQSPVSERESGERKVSKQRNSHRERNIHCRRRERRCKRPLQEWKHNGSARTRLGSLSFLTKSTGDLGHDEADPYPG